MHDACWHSSCRKPFEKDKVSRILSKIFAKEENELTIQPSKRRTLDMDNCIFCERGSGKEDLHHFSNLATSDRVKQWSVDLQDTDLMVRVSGPDLVAMKAKYHHSCLTALKNRHRSYKSKESALTNKDKLLEARAISELFGYIEESVEEGEYFFKLQDLHDMLIRRLTAFGIDKEKNRTQLKEKILLEFPDATEQMVGRQVVIAFPQGLKNLIKDAIKQRDHPNQVGVLANAAKLVREEMFQESHASFNGSFDSECQEKYIPNTLKMLVSMILHGVNINADLEEAQPTLTIAQLLMFNLKKHCNKAKMYHHTNQEPPLCTYLGLKVHAETRSKSLIQTLFKLGISPSYQRILSIEDQLTTAVCEQFNQDGVVIPCSLQKNRFSIGAMDNVDYNPSSSSAQGSFHGTSLNLVQVGDSTNSGEGRKRVHLPPQGKTAELPETYSVVPYVDYQTSKMKVPWRSTFFNPNPAFMDDELERENEWLRKATQLHEKSLQKEDRVAWAAFHAAKQASSPESTCSQGLFPLFKEKAATLSMVKHGMDIIKATVNYLNPGQIPIMVCDQPIYALAKKVQWLLPAMYGEDNFLLWPGGLHIELALWKLPGEMLEGMGWDAIISEAEVTTPGVAKSLLKVSHLMRTRYAYQVSLLSLHILKKKAWDQYQEESGATMTYMEWSEKMCRLSGTFYFWNMISELSKLILMFVRAHREQNFFLYVQVLKQLAPYFFALDHPNYSRLIAIHLRDIGSLDKSLQEEFCKGNWVVQKTNKRFSTIPVDQNHEQNNRLIKTTGGFIGLTENPSGLKRWMISGPELARIIDEFETDEETDEENFHHQEGHAVQVTFQGHVRALVQTIEAKGNPFLDNFPELVTLDSRKVLDLSIVQSLRSLVEVGQANYSKFVKDVLNDRISCIDEPLKRNNLALPKNPRVVVKSKKTEKLRVLQNNIEIFGQLYLSHRESDRDEFFTHEAGPFPQSLSENGKMHFPASKSDLLKCFPSMEDTAIIPGEFDCIIIDGSAAAHYLPPESNQKDFSDYAKKRIVPYVEGLWAYCDRLDVVFDRYLPDSLKSAVREKRGSGERYKVEGHVKLPRRWADFLHMSENKEELFHFLAKEIFKCRISEQKQLNVTKGSEVLSKNTPQMPTCSHEEADSRMYVHLLDALEEGNNKIMLRTVDTDVVVICIGKFYDLSGSYPDLDIWIKFGSGKDVKNIHINFLCQSLGKPKSRSMPFFHALTGSDTTSAFKGRAKKTAWQTWMSCEFITPVFEYFSQNPFSEVNGDSSEFHHLEKFVVRMYSKNVDAQTVNTARKLIFASNQNLEKIPPTKDALLQHVKRAIFQTGE